MWFKNLKLYKFTSPYKIDDDSLQSMLESMNFKTCSSQETASMGWVSPIPKTESLYHKANFDYLFCLKREQKLLPSSVVNSELSLKIGEIENETGSPVPKKAQKDLKEEIIHRLLPRAFSKFSFVQGFLSIDKQILVVDASSDTTAELFLACLRKSLGTLPVVPFAKTQQQQVLTSWLTEKTPENIEILDEAEFQSSAEDGAVVKCKKQELDADEVLSHINAGKLIHKLAICYDGKINCIIENDLSIKRLKFTDIVTEKTQDIPKEELAAKIDADFVLFASEIKTFAGTLELLFNTSED